MDKKWFIAGGIILLLVIVNWLGKFGEVRSSVKQNKEQVKIEATVTPTATPEVKVVYSIDAQTKVIRPGDMEVFGKTNLPEGSVLEVTAVRRFTYEGESKLRSGLKGQGSDTATVYDDGTFSAGVYLDDEEFLKEMEISGEKYSLNPKVLVTVVFDPTRNNVPAIGLRGEKLVGSPQMKVYGEKTSSPYNYLQVEMEVPLAL